MLAWGLVNIPMWGYRQVLTAAQIELLAVDKPIVTYPKKQDKPKKHTKKEMDELTRKWMERKREEEARGEKFSLNDFLRTGRLTPMKD